MITGRRASDWLRHATSGNQGEGDDQRRGSDRRALDRRAPHRRIDPLFAATLLNQITPPAAPFIQGYRAPAANPRRGALKHEWA